MGLIHTKRLKKCLELSVKSFCRRRLPVFMIKSGMFHGKVDVATKYVQHGHVRVGPQVVKDPAFLVTRNHEDFLTWTETFKKKIDEYNNERDDYVDWHACTNKWNESRKRFILQMCLFHSNEFLYHASGLMVLLEVCQAWQLCLLVSHWLVIQTTLAWLTMVIKVAYLSAHSTPGAACFFSCSALIPVLSSFLVIVVGILCWLLNWDTPSSASILGHHRMNNKMKTAPQPPQPPILKVIMVGAGGVGKSALTLQFMYDEVSILKRDTWQSLSINHQITDTPFILACHPF